MVKTWYDHGRICRRSGLPNRVTYHTRPDGSLVLAKSKNLIEEGVLGTATDDIPSLICHTTGTTVYSDSGRRFHRHTGPTVETSKDSMGGVEVGDHYIALPSSFPTKLVREKVSGSIRVTRAWAVAGHTAQPPSHEPALVLQATDYKCKPVAIEHWHRASPGCMWRTVLTYADGTTWTWWTDEHGRLNDPAPHTPACQVSTRTTWSHFKDGLLHSPDNDTPALVTESARMFYKNGSLHRDHDLPAIYSGDKLSYYVHGCQRHDPSVTSPTNAEGVIVITRSLNFLKLQSDVRNLLYSS